MSLIEELNLLEVSTRFLNSEKYLRETAFRFLFKFDFLILSEIGSIKTMRGVKKVSAIRIIKEK